MSACSEEELKEEEEGDDDDVHIEEVTIQDEVEMEEEEPWERRNAPDVQNTQDVCKAQEVSKPHETRDSHSVHSHEANPPQGDLLLSLLDDEAPSGGHPGQGPPPSQLHHRSHPQSMDVHSPKAPPPRAPAEPPEPHSMLIPIPAPLSTPAATIPVPPTSLKLVSDDRQLIENMQTSLQDMLTLLQGQQREISELRVALDQQRQTNQSVEALQGQLDQLEGALSSKVTGALTQHQHTQCILSPQ